MKLSSKSHMARLTFDLSFETFCLFTIYMPPLVDKKSTLGSSKSAPIFEIIEQSCSSTIGPDNLG